MMPKALHAALTTAVLLPLLTTTAQAEHASVIVFDASGSMWAQLEDGKSRVEIARDVIGDFAARRDADVPIGVVSYGHTRRGDCGDIETVLPGGDLAATIGALNPTGKTPLTDAMAQARDLLPRTAEAADITLITDGLENCGGDPCAPTSSASRWRPRRSRRCPASPTRPAGSFSPRSPAPSWPVAREVTLRAVDARTGETLPGATWEVGEESGEAVFSGRDRGRIALDLMPGDHVADVGAPGFAGEARFTVPDREAPPVEIAMEKTEATLYLRAEDAETGETLQGVDWLALNVETEDAVEVVNDEGAYTRLLLPPGEYRIEGSLGAMRGTTSVDATLDEDPRIDVALAAPTVEVSLTAPSEVRAGATFEVTVEGADSDTDYLLIAREGSPEEISRYQRVDNRVGGDGPQAHTAPSDPGDYELRYYLLRDDTIAARHPLTVLPAAIRLEAPGEVGDEAEFEVSIGGDISGYVVIVEEGRAPDDTVSRYHRMKNSVDGDEGKITRTAPETAGAYLLRYHAGDDQRLLVEQPLVVT